MFYDGNKLLNTKDLNKNTPEIFICVSNRSAGKTTYFCKAMVDAFLERGEQFFVIVRTKNEVKSGGLKFYSVFDGLFFQENAFSTVKIDGDNVHAITIDNKICGFVGALNAADKIKPISNIFSRVNTIFFDEFQAEHYLPNEIDKFQSIHTSIARGGGAQSRYVKCILCSNYLSVLNPYFTALKISERVNPQAKFIRGNGWVLEQNTNLSAETARQNSVFNRAFGFEHDSREYALDNNDLIGNASGNSRYLFTIVSEKQEYGVYAFENFYYVSDRVDKKAPKIACGYGDIAPNVMHKNTQSTTISWLKACFCNGNMKFKNHACKNAALVLLSSCR